MTPLKQRVLESMQVRHFTINTQKAYLYWLYELTRYYHHSPDLLTDTELKDFLWALSVKRKLSTSTCQQAYQAIRFFFNEVLNHQFTIKLLPPMKRQQKIPELLSPSEVRRILNACTNLKYHTILSVCYGCGLRVSEAVSLSVSDIDGEMQTLHIHLGKGAKDRIVPLSDTLLYRLRNYWHHYHPKKYLFYGYHRSQHLSTTAVQKTYHRVKDNAGINKSGGIHALRHAFATHQLTAGMQLAQLQQLLGHRDIRTTLRYTHWLPNYQRMQESQFDLLGNLDIN